MLCTLSSRIISLVKGKTTKGAPAPIRDEEDELEADEENLADEEEADEEEADEEADEEDAESVSGRCDCSWARWGCGRNDGSRCWRVCCGRG